jgi:hypothetical protein
LRFSLAAADVFDFVERFVLRFRFESTATLQTFRDSKKMLARSRQRYRLRFAMLVFETVNLLFVLDGLRLNAKECSYL